MPSQEKLLYSLNYFHYVNAVNYHSKVNNESLKILSDKNESTQNSVHPKDNDSSRHQDDC